MQMKLIVREAKILIKINGIATMAQMIVIAGDLMRL